MFKGVFEHQLDDKNRLRIPSRFKKELTGENGDKTYSFFRGMNNCIWVMADDDLDDAIASISEEAISEEEKPKKSAKETFASLVDTLKKKAAAIKNPAEGNAEGMLLGGKRAFFVSYAKT